MIQISHKDFQALCQRQDFKVLEANKYGPKVLETPNDEIIKIFRRKRGISSDFFNPYALRFYRNACKLATLNISAPDIQLVQRCKKEQAFILQYPKLPGVCVSALVRAGNTAILQDAIHFIWQLHQQGVFFRAIHLSNLLYDPTHGFSLIDIADLKIKRKPLSFHARYRNLKHLFLHHKDKELWGTIGIARGIKFYFEKTTLTLKQKSKLLSIAFT